MAGDEHITEATSGNTRFVQHNGLCLALLEVCILCYKQEVKSSVSITRGPAVCQTFCWAWGGAGSSGKLAAGPPGPWGVSSPSCRTEVLEVKAHVSFGRRIRGGLHRSSRLGHRQSRHRAVARAALRCPRRGRSAHTRRAGLPGPGSPWLLPKDFQLFCRGRRGPPCGGVGYRIPASWRPRACHSRRPCRLPSSGWGLASPLGLHAFPCHPTATS